MRCPECFKNDQSNWHRTLYGVFLPYDTYENSEEKNRIIESLC